MSVVDSQIRLLKERLAQLRQQKAVGRLKASGISKARRTANREARARRAFALRLTRHLTFRAVGKMLGVNASGARGWFNRGNWLYTRRKQVPAFHFLEGETWAAHNCKDSGNWFGRCGRGDRHLHTVSRFEYGKFYL